MCRFLAYKGEPLVLHDVLVKPAHSIIAQSYRAQDRGGALNGDGFGLGWYEAAISELPAIFRSLQPAWGNANLASVARLIRTAHFVAHVRGAYEGMEVSELNCHPFHWRQFMFMHNGLVAEFPKVRLHLRSMLSDEAFTTIRGTTDSEQLFALFIDRWRRLGSPRESDGVSTALVGALGVLNEILGEIDADTASNLNLVVTDGHTLVATRYNTSGEVPPSLYLAAGDNVLAGSGYRHTSPDDSSRGVFVASERFSDDGSWESVLPNHIVVVQEDLTVSSTPITV